MGLAHVAGRVAGADEDPVWASVGQCGPPSGQECGQGVSIGLFVSGQRRTRALTPPGVQGAHWWPLSRDLEFRALIGRERAQRQRYPAQTSP